MGSTVTAATTLIFNQANAVQVGSISLGTVDSTTVTNIGPAGNLDRLISYNINNLDFDGDDIADPFVVQLFVESNGTEDGNVSANLNGNGSFGVNSDNDVNGQLDVIGEELTFSFGTHSITLSGGGTVPAISSEDFIQADLRGFGNNSRYFLNGGTIALDANPTDTVALSSDTFSIGLCKCSKSCR